MEPMPKLSHYFLRELCDGKKIFSRNTQFWMQNYMMHQQICVQNASLAWLNYMHVMLVMPQKFWIPLTKFPNSPSFQHAPLDSPPTSSILFHHDIHLKSCYHAPHWLQGEILLAFPPFRCIQVSFHDKNTTFSHLPSCNQLGFPHLFMDPSLSPICFYKQFSTQVDLSFLEFNITYHFLECHFSRFIICHWVVCEEASASGAYSTLNLNLSFTYLLTISQISIAVLAYTPSSCKPWIANTLHISNLQVQIVSKKFLQHFEISCIVRSQSDLHDQCFGFWSTRLSLGEYAASSWYCSNFLLCPSCIDIFT